VPVISDLISMRATSALLLWEDAESKDSTVVVPPRRAA
jgi:hypothetical protein